VLRHKKSRKIASRQNQRTEAMTLEAQRLNEDCNGGGIVTLLLPISPEEEVSVAKIAGIYTAERVMARPGAKSGTSDRKKLKMAIGNDELITKLVCLYSKHNGDESGPQTNSVKAFTRWLKEVLQCRGSPAYRVIHELAPVLLDVERGDRWWESAIAGRRKRRVKDS
jgi:hypothetical protein